MGMGAQLYQYRSTLTWQNPRQQQERRETNRHKAVSCAVPNGIHSIHWPAQAKSLKFKLTEMWLAF